MLQAPPDAPAAPAVTATPTPPPIQPAPAIPVKKEQDVSMVDTIARRFVVPLALVLDIAATFIRIAQTTVQLTLPDVYAAWNSHTSGVTGALYYTSNAIVIAAISIGTTASLFLTMPLLYQIATRLDAASQIRNKKIKNERLKHLRQKQRRYVNLVVSAIIVPLMFGVSYFLASFHLGILDFVTAIADIAAPILILYTITNSEREYRNLDPQERTMKTTTDVVITSANRIGDKFGTQGISAQEATMLKRGIEGDITGMIDATIPLDPKVRYYSVTEICHKLHVTADSRSPYRKRIQRIIEAAYKGGELRIRQDEKRQAWMVPASIFDDLFGSFDEVIADVARNQEAFRTRPTRAPRPGATRSGHKQDRIETPKGQNGSETPEIAGDALTTDPAPTDPQAATSGPSEAPSAPEQGEPTPGDATSAPAAPPAPPADDPTAPPASDGDDPAAPQAPPNVTPIRSGIDTSAPTDSTAITG